MHISCIEKLLIHIYPVRVRDEVILIQLFRAEYSQLHQIQVVMSELILWFKIQIPYENTLNLGINMPVVK